MVKHSFAHVVFLVLAMAVLSGCGGQQPKTDTLPQQLGYVASIIEGVTAAISDSLDAKSITAEEAESMLNRVEEAKQTLALANDYLRQGLPDNAMETMALARKVLLEIQEDLRRRAEQ